MGYHSLASLDLLGALTHLAALLLETAGALLLPLPPKHRARLLVGVRLVRHGKRP